MSRAISDARHVAEVVAMPVPRRLRAWQRGYLQLLWISDALVVTLVIAGAQSLRFGSLHGGSLAGYNSVGYSMVSLALAAAWLAAMAIYRTRSHRVIGSGLEEYRRVWAATLSLFGAVAVVSTLFRLDIARGYLAIALPAGLMMLTVNRWLWRRYVAHRRVDGAFMNTVLAVGRPDSVEELAEALAKRPAEGYRVIGVCAPGLFGRDRVNIPGLGDVPVFPNDEDLAAVVAESGADTVVLTSGYLRPDAIRDLSWQLEKLDVDLVVSPGMVDVAGPRLTVRLVGGQPLIHVDKPRYDDAKCFQKRVFDICFSILALTLVSPILVGAALAIKLSSRGPVLYLSERIGLDGKPFQMIKFRSMIVDADRRLSDVAHLDEGGGVLFKIRRDPRITPVGRFLRRYSLDELPQFFNVLSGAMSVVGPRPPLPNEVASYNSQIWRRLLVRPGITGLWQVSGRSDLTWEESVRLDLSYVENWSMLTDLAIAVKTVRAIWLGSGAY
ncbi:sugar transferase [Mycobacterium sp. 141]|uniref:sugar transferase n=1 Tax=Mycobacterium sp. 141 TaxID=1120797 RepID=UPI0009DAD3A2